jgi:O-acetyl-ADP-ribose deacetylase (regulator of RNase III)
MELLDDAPIPLASLRRWQPLNEELETNPFDASPPHPSAAVSASAPFAFDAQLNSRVALWHGPIWRLAADAVVNSTNESLSDTSGLCRSLLDAAGKEIWTECASAGPCRTGEAVATRGCRLPARKILHTVAPRYSDAYKSAAEHALHMCYRSALSAAVELQLASVAFPCVYVKRKGYPRDAAAHVAARTVRRFLEHYRDAFECVVFCVDSLEDQLQYEAVLPLYFPRDPTEEAQSARLLDGRPLGDAFGEPVIEERKIRISESLVNEPLDAPEENGDHEQDVDACVKSFCEMSADPDVERLERLRKLQAQREQLRRKNQPSQRVLPYATALATARQHDWHDLTARKFLYNAGVDHSGETVIVYMASRLSVTGGGSKADDVVDLERVMLFIIQFMDAIVEKKYSVLYVHDSSASDETQLSAAWLKRLVKTFSSKYQQNLRFFYVYEPSLWFKLLLLVAKGFVSSTFYKKIVYLASPEDLAHVASALDVPHYMNP